MSNFNWAKCTQRKNNESWPFSGLPYQEYVLNVSTPPYIKCSMARLLRQDDFFLKSFLDFSALRWLGSTMIPELIFLRQWVLDYMHKSRQKYGLICNVPSPVGGRNLLFFKKFYGKEWGPMGNASGRLEFIFRRNYWFLSRLLFLLLSFFYSTWHNACQTCAVWLRVGGLEEGINFLWPRIWVPWVLCETNPVGNSILITI